MPPKEPQAPKWKWIYAKASFKYFSIIKSSTLDKWNHYSANHFSFFIIIWLLGQAEQYVYICHLLGNNKKNAHSGCNKLHEHHMLKHTQTHKPAMCDAPCTKAEKKLHMHPPTPLAAGNGFLRYYISHVSLGLCFLVFASVHNPCSWCAFASHDTDPSSWHASSCIPAVSLTRTRLNNFFHFREVSVAAACMSLGQVGETVSRTFLFKNIRLPRRRCQDNCDPEQSLVNRAPKARDGHVGRKLTAECEL